MRNSTDKTITKTTIPFCQATGCFERADMYVVVKESEEPFTYDEIRRNDGHEKIQRESDTEFDGFKLILYLCNRHQNDFHYLLNGSELYISKRSYLGSSGIHLSSK